MDDISTLVTTNFTQNIAYIQENHPELFAKLSALESAMEQGHYQEKYELVYEENNFDVVEKSTATYLYNKESSTHASLASQSIDYKLDENLFEGFHRHTISDADLTHYKNEAPFKHEMSGFAPIIHFTQHNSNKNKTLQHLEKFIFFGVGLGLHIDSIDKKISSKVYFIIEDDLELFRLSLFTTNYQKLSSKAKLIFSVFEESNEFFKSAEKFLQTEYYYNHYIKYFRILSHSDEKIKQFQIAIGSQSHLLFFYNSLLSQYLQPLEYIFNNYKFLNNTLNFNSPEFNKKPFLLVAAGPSLEKNIAWLKENHTHFSIVALSATLCILEKEGITPDIITHIDAFANAKVHFEKLDSLEFIKNSLLIYSSRIPKNVISMFEKKQLFFIESGTEYKKDSLKLSAPCVGSLTYQLLLKSNVKNIYLLGLDMAIDAKTGKTHSSTHEYNKVLTTSNDADNMNMIFKESLLSVAGNFSKSVQTTPNFKISIDSINNATKLLKSEHQEVYNLNDGAKFLDTIPYSVNNIKKEKHSKDIKQHLFKICSLNASSHLSSMELETLKEKLLHAKKMKDILEVHKTKKRVEVAHTLDDLKELSKILCSSEYMKKYELSRVLDTYLKYILSYIFEYCNQQTSKQTVHDCQILDRLLTSHLLLIVDFYHDTLKQKGNL